MKRSYLLMYVCFFLAFSLESFAQEQKDSVIMVTPPSPNKKEEKNRNVMLNAENSSSPRDVNIGLPFMGDIVILENDVPVVYYFYPTNPMGAWRVDNSLTRMGLLSFEEGALLYGKVGFAVTSADREFGRKFQGYGSAFMSSFGSSRFDLTITSPIGKKGWGFMSSFYQNFDRGNGIDYKYTPWQDKTTQAKFSLQKEYKNGKLSFLYKMVDSKVVMSGYYPVMYEGDGETSEMDGFRLGKDSYVPYTGLIPYQNYKGEIELADMDADKWSRSVSHNFYIIGENRLKNGWKLNYTTMFQSSNSPMGIAFPLSLNISDNTGGFVYAKTGQAYTGDYRQLMYNQLIPQSDCKTSITRVEMTKKVKNHDLRFGATYQMFRRKYETGSGAYYMSVEPNPEVLVNPTWVNYHIMDATGLLTTAPGGGIKEDNRWNKAALYASDDFTVGQRLDLGVGARLEHQAMKQYHDPYVNNEALGERELVESDFKSRLNKVGYVKAVYKLGKNWGVLGDASYNSEYQSYWDYPTRNANGVAIDDDGKTASQGGTPRSTVDKDFETYVSKLSGGLYLNVGRSLNIVSKVTSIQKKNVISKSAQLDDPSGSGLRYDFGPIFYDINTLGWSTDIVAEPFKNFNIHYLLTIQNPQYKNYVIDATSAFGEDGYYDYSDKVIPTLSKVLMEIDPSYMFMKGKLKAWFSLRYYGKQYGNTTNAFSYNPWWENFGGLDYMVNRNLAFKLQVVNFLDQAGVKGEIQGANQINSDAAYIGRPIVASAIRPRTVELKIDFKF